MLQLILVQLIHTKEFFLNKIRKYFQFTFPSSYVNFIRRVSIAILIRSAKLGMTRREKKKGDFNISYF